MKARVAYFNCCQIFHVLTHSVVSPNHIDADPDADPDSAYHPDADPDSDFYLMRMRILVFTLMLTRMLIQILASK